MSQNVKKLSIAGHLLTMLSLAIGESKWPIMYSCVPFSLCIAANHLRCMCSSWPTTQTFAGASRLDSSLSVFFETAVHYPLATVPTVPQWYPWQLHLSSAIRAASSDETVVRLRNSLTTIHRVVFFLLHPSRPACPRRHARPTTSPNPLRNASTRPVSQFSGLPRPFLPRLPPALLPVQSLSNVMAHQTSTPQLDNSPLTSLPISI